MGHVDVSPWEEIMDIGVTPIMANLVMAALIYIVVENIWQE
ncbi:MAG: hypothetical protein P0111_11015 [Nitrospira sp.]|nr:hypothetical protein [Nitrospira sp.]